MLNQMLLRTTRDSLPQFLKGLSWGCRLWIRCGLHLGHSRRRLRLLLKGEVVILNGQEQHPMTMGDGLYSDQEEDHCPMAAAAGLHSDQEISAKVAGAMLGVLPVAKGISSDQGFTMPDVELGHALMAEEDVILPAVAGLTSSSKLVMGNVTKAVDVLVTEEVNVEEVTESYNVAKAGIISSRLTAGSVANKGAVLDAAEFDKSVSGNRKVGLRRSKSFGVSVKTVEPRQSERLKLQKSGDEDLVQKATRRAKIRNLEFDPSKSDNKLSFVFL